MKTTTLVIRILLGLMLVVFGLNKFLQFMPMPEMNSEASALMGAFVNSGYIMMIVAIIEIGTGILFLINKYTALASILLFPIMLNAFLFHLFMDIGGIGASALLLAFNIFMLFANKVKFSEMLKA